MEREMHVPSPPFAGKSARIVDGILRFRPLEVLVAPRRVEDYVRLITPTWSASRVLARVVRKTRETTDAVSIHLSPNRRFGGFRAGQFVQVSVRHDGVRHTRTYSLSSAPEDPGPLRITVRAFPRGLVSNHLAHDTRIGDVVELSSAMGDFILPEPLPERLLFISGGSGITPIASMIRSLVARGYDGEITSLHYARDEVIFERELIALAFRHPRLRFIPIRTRRTARHEASPARFSEATLAHYAPRDAEVFVCGPPPLEEAVHAALVARGATDRLHVERFGLVPRARSSDASSRQRHQLVLAKSGVVLEVDSNRAILEQVERAGLRPSHGCRMGICHSCKRRKIQGSVRNELTGRISDAADELIQICISTPVSDVTLDL